MTGTRRQTRRSTEPLATAAQAAKLLAVLKGLTVAEMQHLIGIGGVLVEVARGRISGDEILRLVEKHRYKTVMAFYYDAQSPVDLIRWADGMERWYVKLGPGNYVPLTRHYGVANFAELRPHLAEVGTWYVDCRR